MTGARMMGDAHLDLDREVDRLSERLRQPFGAWLRRLHGGSSWHRVPAGVGLVAGGVFSFLPVLGFWMLPLGIVLLAKDVPPLRGPSARMLAFVHRKFPPKAGRDAGHDGETKARFSWRRLPAALPWIGHNLRPYHRRNLQRKDS